MNGKKRKSTQAQPCNPNCLCAGAGPALTELLCRLGPPQDVRQHFDAARVEFLKGIRAIIDARINRFSKPSPSSGRARGQRINVK